MDNHTVFDEATRNRIVETIESPQSLSEMEHTLRQLLHKLGNILLHMWLIWQTPRYCSPSVACPHCGADTQYQRKRWGKLLTMFGEVRYRRGYYVCPQCHQGHYPLDEQLGLRPNAMSAEVERLAAMTGVQMPFGKGRTVFAELTLLSLSDQSLDKATQAYGTEVEKQENVWLSEARDGDALRRRAREHPRPLRLYGTMDGGRVQTRAQQGADQPWRELKVGAWFTAKGQPPRKPNGKWGIHAQNITYYADIAHADDFGHLVWASGIQRDAQRARELIFLGDGARWIWDLVSLHFPHAIQIVDWFHACEYLTPVAKVACRDVQQQKQWLEQVKMDLWQGKIAAVIAACAPHIDPRREGDPAQKAVTYYTNNQQRMDYPTYRANGYQIGSGTIESAVKQITTQRMKVPGARWNLHSARLVAKARAAFLSGQWHDLATPRKSLSKCA
jgi:hypothetical protein